MHLSGIGQSLSTDPAQYVYHARNEILYGDWDPFDYPHWTVYQHSLTSAIGYIWFSIAGVSITQANAVGMIMSLLGLVFILLGLYRHHRPWVLTAVALCYVINICLLTYGRLAYLENGLILIASIMFFVYTRFGERTWGIALCGILIAAAAILGKLFGVILLPALLVAIWMKSERMPWLKMITAAVSTAVTAGVLIVVLYGSDATTAFEYAREQSYDLRGFPPGLASPWAFLEYLVAFGFNNRMFYLSPDLFVFVVVGASLLLMVCRDRQAFRDLSPAVALMVPWVGFFVLAMMPLSYSPLRYSLILMPAIIVMAFGLIDDHLGDKKVVLLRPGYVRAVLLSMLIWFVAHHVLRNLFFYNGPTAEWTGWPLLPVSIVLALGIRWLLEKQKIIITQRAIVIGLAMILALSMVSNGFRIRRLQYLDHVFSINYANQDIGTILSPNAVVSGPYGPILTQNTELKSFIHLFAVAQIDSTLFERHPITHIAVDPSAWDRALAGYPVLSNARLVTSYYIRDLEVSLYNICGVFDNVVSARYEPSGYEKAQFYRKANKIDSAMYALSEFMETSTTTRSVAILVADLLLTAGSLDQAQQVLIGVANNYPDDFYLQMHCGRLYMIQSLMTNSPALMEIARQYFERGVTANRFKSDFAMRLAAETQRLFEAGQGP
jgi:hypothetical protein